MTAGQLLRRAREQAGISQTELARRARTKQSAISRVECDVVSPTVETLTRWVRSTGVELRLELGPRKP